ncbi:unnamed protein product [Caenorhabditis nigoni]
MRRGSKILLGCLTTVTLFNLYRFLGSEDYKDWVEAEQDEIDMKSVFKRFDTNEIFQKWHNCISEQLLWIQDAEKFWNDFMFASKRCDLRANVAQIGLITLKNSDEMKHVIFPKIYNFGPHNLFSIGIGRDIQAERQFRRKMRKLGNNVTFYGADPVSMINDNLYSQIGTYFPLAIGSNSGISKAMVMVEDGGYAPKSIVHVDIVYFFKNLLNVTKIDNLWFDAEGAEFGDGFFEIFYKNGRFDQNSIDICQINIEVHKNDDYPERKRKFMEFLCNIAYKILRSCRFKRFPRFPMSYKIGQISQVQHSEFSFFHGPEEIQYCVQKDLDFCEHFLRENFPEHSVKFSENIVCVMVPRDGFKCGRHLQEFLPNEGKLIGSYLTYQFATERAIITHYNLPDGRRFVAGIGIYPRLLTFETGFFSSFPIDEDICQEAMESGYDYVPPKPRKWTKRRAERFEMVTKAARDAGLIRPNESLGNVRFVDNPPVYTKLIIEEEAKLKE